MTWAAHTNPQKHESGSSLSTTAGQTRPSDVGASTCWHRGGIYITNGKKECLTWRNSVDEVRFMYCSLHIEPEISTYDLRGQCWIVPRQRVSTSSALMYWEQSAT